MKTKTLLWSVVSILIIGLVAAAVWWLRRPQVITFSDDSKVTLLGVDYGKLHVPPNVKATAVSTNRALLQRSGSSFVTDDDTLVVWVRQQYDSQQWHNFQYYLYDKSGTVCVGASGMNSDIRGRQNNRVIGVQFSAFPRRQGKFLMGIQENGNGSQEMAEQKFFISNPARGSFTKWAAEPLPATKVDDDLSVTLTRLVFGADTTYNRNQDNADDPVNKGVQATLDVSRNGKPVTNWQPVSIVTSDATGNRINGSANNQWQGNDDVAAYQWGLWPDEPAWKIKFEFSQQSDFAGNELWTVQNIPLLPGRQQEMWNNGGRRPTDAAAFAENDLNGFHLKIFPAKQFTDAGPNSNPQGGLFIQTDPELPGGMHLTLVSLTDNQASNIERWDYGAYRNNNVTTYRYGLRDITGATNLNLTLALHKSRFVEFTAKPEKAAAAAAH